MSSYEPHQLEALGKAFDIAWARLSPSFDNRRAAMEEARLTLAGIVLGLANNGNFDPPWLADDAVRVMLSQERLGGPGITW